MDIITPGIGLLFWNTLFFLIVFAIIGVKIVPVISKGLKDREESIDNALKAAEQAKADIANLKAENEKEKEKARAEREEIITSAKKKADQMIAEATEQAKSEAKKIVDDARSSIDAEKREALAEIKGVVSELSLDIAEKVIRKQLSDDAAQQELVAKLVEDANI
ncbi:F0F1 ATP synthase subunit B [Flammeovirga yaeyamensis]|uniref:ATP synthase subunit b n=1 Tax=Flammeovirga yaeyamensis TaxID=367791 RepID=A0AAX1N4Z2_9BACT|nr:MULTISPECIES: F0F1 ATP synthase subunit B [Flammeovirga]ANQ49996.1 F0F1 ATP synthase subunit B [Flammeovirga sp. MY04]MBB3700491.1 F-type H+-transporting ATPase subunit b [Flammeovirga yaeyamensis]NMF36887.1 F0F1 ATP synthase subunit B [Flammeovirga yaeyamensis]QWG02565.1 F0F1 ATP synthase subunit B [Flammeovirga yaeyamensis]